jgi:hypothetical protein
MRAALVLSLLLFAGLVAMDAIPSGLPLLSRDAAAVCGGGEPGDPCFCPQPPPPLDKLVVINC